MRASERNQRGSITLVALSLAIVIGISLGSYLALCQQSLQFSTRALQHSKARQLAETGLEEALWALNSAANPDSNISSKAWNISSTAPTIPVGSGDPWRITYPRIWTIPITGYDLGDGAKGELKISIQDYHQANPRMPVITVTATVTVPGQGIFTKILTASTKPAPLFANAIGVQNGQLSLPVGTVIDSWDSDYDSAAIAPTPKRDYDDYNVSVLYSAASHPPSSTDPMSYAAVIAAPSINLFNDATVYGYAATLGNSINPSTDCLVKGPSSPAFPKIDPTRVSKSAFIPTFAVKAPLSPPPGSPSPGDIWHDLPSKATWGLTQTIGSGSVTQYWRTVTAESGMDTLNGTGEDLFLDNSTLIIDGPVVLVVQEDFELKNSARIKINSTPNARLEMYVRDDVYISDTAGFQNSTNDPKKLALFCTNEFSGNFDFTYGSSVPFNGVFYSSAANRGMNFTVSPEIFGAILTGFTPSFAGSSTKIHYNSALQYLRKGWFKGVNTPYLIVQVTES